ncbi:MAG: hypothetical protein AAB068_05130 [Pseudomonadota bacterium]
MRIETTDPISGNTIHNLDIETEHPGKDFTTNLDNPSKMGDER